MSNRFVTVTSAGTDIKRIVNLDAVLIAYANSSGGTNLQFPRDADGTPHVLRISEPLWFIENVLLPDSYEPNVSHPVR